MRLDVDAKCAGVYSVGISILVSLTVTRQLELVDIQINQSVIGRLGSQLTCHPNPANQGHSRQQANRLSFYMNHPASLNQTRSGF